MTKFNAQTKWAATQSEIWRIDNRYWVLMDANNAPAEAKRNRPQWAALDILEVDEEAAR